MQQTAQKFMVELVTPASLLLSSEVDMVIIPGTEGDFGVLANHAPMISSIRNGVVRTEGRAGGDQDIFVAGGFAEVTGERCTIIAEEAIPVDQIDRATVEHRLHEAEKALRLAEDEDSKRRAEANRQLATAMLELIP